MKKVLFCIVGIVLLFSALAVTKEEAKLAIENATNDIQLMKEANFSTNYVEDLLELAKQAYERAEFADILKHNATGELAKKAKEYLSGLDWRGFSYDDVIVYTNNISYTKERAFYLFDRINAMEKEISYYESLGVNVSGAYFLLEKARNDFYDERYDDVEKDLQNLELALEEEERKQSLIYIYKESAKNFFVRNWKDILALVGFLIVLGIILHSIISRMLIKKKIKKLESERQALKELIKKTQTERFKLGKIPEAVYKIRINKYKEKLAEIERTLPVLKNMLKKKKKK